MAQEIRRGAVKDRPSWPFSTANLLHQSFTEKTFQYPVAVDPSDGIHLRAGYGLLVRNDRQSLQGGTAEVAASFQTQEFLNE